MSEKDQRFLVVATYKAKIKLFEAKPVWQVIDTQENCKVVADNFKTADEARKKRDELAKNQELHERFMTDSVAQAK